MYLHPRQKKEDDNKNKTKLEIEITKIEEATSTAALGNPLNKRGN